MTHGEYRLGFSEFHSSAQIGRYGRQSRLMTIGLVAVFLLPLHPGMLLGQRKVQQVRQEEREDYFKKWLEQDVAYIIAPSEKEVFGELSTIEERESFIEQFWYRRDSNPTTELNEFKEEHYRRIAYSNERFQSGKPGWKTDRGRIYIIHGAPSEIISHPSGGRYLRKPSEGGGSTSTYPFETWRYHHIGGVGENVELEFVDPTWSGQYHLAVSPDEKDALLRVPNAGMTRAEELGLASKMDRPFFQPGNRTRYPLQHEFQSENADSPFARFERVTQVSRPTEITYTDLKAVVETNVTYDDLAINLRTDYFRLDSRRDLVPITLEIPNNDLTFDMESTGFYTAKLAVYGVITSIRNRLVYEFEDELVFSCRPDQLNKILRTRSAYQKIVSLDSRALYKLAIVVKDLNSGTLANVTTRLAPPSFDSNKPVSSDIILSDLIVPVSDTAPGDTMFVLGGYKVRPSVENIFPAQYPLGLYLQIYHLGIDQSRGGPSVETQYRISRGNRVIVELSGGLDEWLRSFPDSVVLIKQIPAQDLQPGAYTLTVEIHDLVSNETLTKTVSFRLLEM